MPQGLKWLHAVGANIDLPTFADIDGMCTFSTPLHLAAMRGQFGLAKVLFKLGCNLDKRTIFGKTPAFVLACTALPTPEAQPPLEVNAPNTKKCLTADLYSVVMATAPSAPMNVQ